MTTFIAELGSNHNGDLARAHELIDACAAAGATAAKVQVFRIDDLFAPEVLASRPEIAAREAWELPLALLAPLAARARRNGMTFGATPFGLWAVEEVAEHVDFLKIASYELLWHDLLRACAATGKPLIVSTGMATDERDRCRRRRRARGRWRRPHAAALRERLSDPARAVQPRGDRGAARAPWLRGRLV